MAVLRYDRFMRQRGYIFVVAVACVIGASAMPRALTDITVPSLNGVMVSPLRSTGDVTVLIFVTTDCPIANRYAPEIRRIHEEFGEEVTFWLVYIANSGQVSELAEHRDSFGFPMKAVRDLKNELAQVTGATVTPEVAVYDVNQELSYRGRINDQYVEFGIARAAARTHDLRDVLARLVAGEQVAFSETQAVGCYIPGVGN